MNHLATTILLLWVFAATTIPLNIAGAQNSPVESTQTAAADPATDADFYLQKAATKVAELRTFVESFRNKTDIQQVPFRPIVYSKRDIEQARATLKLAKAQIDQLPDDVNAGRDQKYRRLSRQTQRLDNYLTVIRTDLLTSLNPKAFPDLKTDAVRFRGLGTMLANIDSFDSDPELAATILKQLPAARQEANRITTKYDLLIQQETVAGLQLAGLERYFESKRKSFEAVAMQQREVLPERIKKNLSVVNEALLSRSERRLSASQKSAAVQTPMGFQSQLRKIEADLNLLETIDPRSSRFWLAYHKQLDDLTVAVQNTEPADGYAGEDRDDLEKALLFSRAKPGVVNIRIPSKNWTRQTYWRFNGVQWKQIDRSILQAYLFAEDSDDTSSGWQGFLLTKDHLDKDAISAKRN